MLCADAVCCATARARVGTVWGAWRGVPSRGVDAAWVRVEAGVQRQPGTRRLTRTRPMRRAPLSTDHVARVWGGARGDLRAHGSRCVTRRTGRQTRGVARAGIEGSVESYPIGGSLCERTRRAGGGCAFCNICDLMSVARFPCITLVHGAEALAQARGDAGSPLDRSRPPSLLFTVLRFLAGSLYPRELHRRGATARWSRPSRFPRTQYELCDCFPLDKKWPGARAAL